MSYTGILFLTPALVVCGLFSFSRDGRWLLSSVSSASISPRYVVVLQKMPQLVLHFSNISMFMFCSLHVSRRPTYSNLTKM